MKYLIILSGFVATLSVDLALWDAIGYTRPGVIIAFAFAAGGMFTWFASRMIFTVPEQALLIGLLNVSETQFRADDTVDNVRRDTLTKSIRKKLGA